MAAKPKRKAKLRKGAKEAYDIYGASQNPVAGLSYLYDKFIADKGKGRKPFSKTAVGKVVTLPNTVKSKAIDALVVKPIQGMLDKSGSKKRKPTKPIPFGKRRKSPAKVNKKSRVQVTTLPNSGLAKELNKTVNKVY
jgi:hypothetical protein